MSKIKKSTDEFKLIYEKFQNSFEGFDVELVCNVALMLTVQNIIIMAKDIKDAKQIMKSVKDAMDKNLFANWANKDKIMQDCTMKLN